MMRSLRPALLAAPFLLLVSISQAFAEPLTVGQPAPPLTFTRLTNAPTGVHADWASLRGKVVVLEFWATWCEGCIQQIPHLNALTRELAQEPVQFIAVDDEEPAVAEKLLKRFPIESWVAYDTTKKMIEAYGAQARPRTVVVDPKGNIAAILNPDQLTAVQLKALAHGQTVVFPADTMAGLREEALQQAKAADDTSSKPNAPQPLLDISVRPGDPKSHMMMMRKPGKNGAPDSLDILNASLSMLLTYGAGGSSTRLTVTAEPQATFSLHVSAPGDDLPELAPAIEQALSTAAGMKLRRTTTEEEVWVLQATPQAARLLKPPTSEHGGMCYVDPQTGKLMLMMSTMADLAQTLENEMKTPVVDGTGIAGKFDAVVDYPKGGPEAVRAMLEQQFGLTLLHARRPIERVILEPVAPPAAKSAPPTAKP